MAFKYDNVGSPSPSDVSPMINGGAVHVHAYTPINALAKNAHFTENLFHFHQPIPPTTVPFTAEQLNNFAQLGYNQPNPQRFESVFHEPREKKIHDYGR